MAAITPEERWKKSIYASVIGAEQVQWSTSIYAFVLNAEATCAQNLATEQELDKQNVLVQRRLEHQKRLDRKAKKFAVRAERFRKMRQDGGADDDPSVTGSVTSSLGTHRRRRRRGRKSAVMQTDEPLVEETTMRAEAEVAVVTLTGKRVGIPPATILQVPIVPTAEEIEKQARQQWRNSIYVSILQADQNQWKKNIYSHTIHAEEYLQTRRKLEALIAKERFAFNTKREKARKIKLRAKKMEKMRQLRDAADDTASAAGSATSSRGTHRRRRRQRKSTVVQMAVPSVEETTMLAEAEVAVVSLAGERMDTAPAATAVNTAHGRFDEKDAMEEVHTSEY